LLQAEFENAQKRWNKNKNDLRLEYTASVLKKFLPLYDSYKKAIENNPDNENIKQFYNQFLSIIKAHDGAAVMKVNINDPFDYHYHEALSSIERDDLPNNTIIDIIQDGWMIGKDVLRYAKVVTSRKPKPVEPETKKEETEGSKQVEETNNLDGNNADSLNHEN
ncbi:MAG: nucleotide exchange factor GrpE, partial [Promethearchaeota archaeon]